jgi:carbon-monoxide dehydrogenase large subunit
MIERLIDTAGRELGLEPDEIRRRNFFEIGDEPHVTAMGTPFDSGNFKQTMAKALEQADWEGFPAREAESHKRGKLRGRGMSYYCELTLGNPVEAGQIRFTEDDRVQMIVGTLSHGQGHATTFAQIVADRLGIDVDRIDLVQGDTDIVKSGGGTGGSRSTQMGGNALLMAADASVEKGKQLAAEMLEAAAADIEYGEGKFTVVGTDRSIGLFDVAKRAQDKTNLPEHLQEALADGLDSDETYNMQESTFPNGCHVCEVEIDPETGLVTLAAYSVVDDFGRVINPMIVEGQVHGGVAQGIGQALLEEIVYEPDTGQLLTGSLMDYCMPRAEDMPDMKFSTNYIPCKTNPLGIKGCGEAGTVGAMPATMNAVVDALYREYGIKHIDMPATPLRVWEAIQNAGGAKRAAE